ncbi:carboxypeptidase regulatory-like domain-containing protein [Pontibacter fetidus]|uniref:Carboxypeptidase-like regulatory domain-containing protein n=1 Tax=Pontibacter fetidus TaxID=2700082 RepID=A0A6B2GZW7_9BACT|nr:carboxypeptidase-like regulatory domain-containing protein [Pontibacter fetidus]NDK55408.1 carboxypeptidase-like regulatory domain-containing protein [Pontibacter fetidus]
MKSTLLKTLAFVLYSLSTYTSFAQTTTGQLAGTVQDSLNQKAVPFATIILKKHTDAGFVQVTVADDKGSFSFENLQQGLYFVHTNFLGYKKKQVDSLQVVGAGKTLQLRIALAEDTRLLIEVTVVGQRPFLKYF